MTYLNAVAVLLRAQLQIARNTFWRGNIRRKFGIIVLVAFVGVAAWGLYSFAGFVVRGIRSPEFAEALRSAAAETPDIPTDITPILQTVPSIAFLAALFVLVFSSFTSVLNALYLSGDIDMLLVAPVPMRAVFSVKFFTGLVPQYLLLIALVGPLLLGFGQGMGYGGLYYATTIAALLLFPLLPAGIGALLVMAVVRVLPPQRARNIVSVIGGLFGVSFYIVTQFSAAVVPEVADARNITTLLRFNLPVLPSAWVGRALTAAGEGQYTVLLTYGGLFALVSVGVFAFCLLVAERLYYVGWSNMAIQSGRVRRRTKRPTHPNDVAPQLVREGRLAALASRVLPRESQAIFVKDWRLFRRDLRNLQQLIFPLALAGIWTFRLITTPGGFDTGPSSDIPPAFAQIATLGSAGIAFFICLSLSSALTGAGISREGKAFWILKLAPVAPLRVLLGKMALAYLPYLTIGTLFLVLLTIVSSSGLGTFLFQWLLLLLVGLGATTFGIGLGARFPRLDWDNPQQQTTLRAGILSAIFYPVYLFLTVGFVLGGRVAGVLLPIGTELQFGLVALGWLLAVGITALVVWAGLSLGVSGLRRIEV